MHTDTLRKEMCVHDKEMNKSHKVKYLGDIIHESGKPQATIVQRVNRGYA